MSKGTTCSCTFDELNPRSSDKAIIEGSVATTGFTNAKLLVAATVSVAFESEFGTPPAPQTLVKNTALTLPVLENEGDKEFLGWIVKG